MGRGRHFSLDSMGLGLGPGLPLELPVLVVQLPLFFDFFKKLAANS